MNFTQVSLDHYRDPDFLEDALRRYRMYLFLKRLHTQTFLVPCYDIDLVSGGLLLMTSQISASCFKVLSMKKLWFRKILHKVEKKNLIDIQILYKIDQNFSFILKLPTQKAGHGWPDNLTQGLQYPLKDVPSKILAFIFCQVLKKSGKHSFKITLIIKESVTIY